MTEFGLCEKSTYELLLIPNCYQERERERERDLLEYLDLNPLDSFLWGWMKNNIYETKVGTRAELPFLNLDAAANIKKRGDELRRTTRDLRPRFAKSIKVSGGIFENLS
jgi:hypothetical protein